MELIIFFMLAFVVIGTFFFLIIEDTLETRRMNKHKLNQYTEKLARALDEARANVPSSAPNGIESARAFLSDTFSAQFSQNWTNEHISHCFKRALESNACIDSKDINVIKAASVLTFGTFVSESVCDGIERTLFRISENPAMYFVFYAKSGKRAHEIKIARYKPI